MLIVIPPNELRHNRNDIMCHGQKQKDQAYHLSLHLEE